MSNVTVINSGIHLIKGLNYNTFASGGNTIPEATTVDNIRASYLLKDAYITGTLATATITFASANILSCVGHNLVVNDLVLFTNAGGALPTGLVANTPYFVIATNYTANQFSVSTSAGGAINVISAAGSGTHTVHAGSSLAPATIASDDFVSNVDHSLYLLNTTSATALFASVTRYNIRASLTVGALTGGPASGTSPSAFVCKTTPLLHIGTLSQLNSGRIFTVSHGPASGIKCLYFATTTRIYRCEISNVTSGSINWLSDSMIEVPPGSSTTYSALSTMSQVDYSSIIDRILIPNTGGRFGIYVTSYNTSGDQFDKYIGSNLNRLRLTTTPSGASNGLYPTATATIWTENGWMFVIPSIITTGQNWLYVFPFGCDSYYTDTSNQYVVTPKMSTTGADKLYRVYVNHQEYIDGNLSLPVETYKIWYRTSGIDDNSGVWTEVPIGYDLTSASPGNFIQFKIAFNIMGEICVPTKIYSVCCIYEDNSQDSHYLPSVSKSSAPSKVFAWQQIDSWGFNIPNLKLDLYDSSSNLLIFSDTVDSSAYGTWQYSVDGTNWLPWDETKDTVGYYIRYTATSFGYSGVTVRAILRQA